MKKFLSKLNFLVIISLMLAFVSCGDEYPSEGYFKVGDIAYNINEARLYDLGYDSESELYQLRLTMDNTSHNDFHSINILFYSEVNYYLPNGIYTPYLYDNNFKNKFKRGAWMIGDEEGGVFLSGKVQVTKTNDVYKINIDCKDINGNDIFGRYDGLIQIMK